MNILRLPILLAVNDGPRQEIGEVFVRASTMTLSYTNLLLLALTESGFAAVEDAMEYVSVTFIIPDPLDTGSEIHMSGHIPEYHRFGTLPDRVVYQVEVMNAKVAVV